MCHSNCNKTLETLHHTNSLTIEEAVTLLIFHEIRYQPFMKGLDLLKEHWLITSKLSLFRNKMCSDKKKYHPLKDNEPLCTF